MINADRRDRVTAYVNDKGYAIIDELLRIARELNTSPAAVALAWVQGRPGVASTIIGARRRDQLEQNLEALDLALRPDHVAALDGLSQPTLNFPAAFFLRNAA